MKKIWFIVFLLVLSFSLVSVSFSADATYLGVKKCKMCHIKQFKTWKSEKHAKAFSALKGDELKNKECLKCHTTGLDKGGYDSSKSADENEAFQNIQCEACHGAGSLHMKAKKADKKSLITLKPDCTKCHNPHINRGEEAKKAREAKETEK